MITLDTSGIVALFIREDQRHREAVRALGSARMPTVVPVGILAEVDEVLGRRLAPRPASSSWRASRRARPCSIMAIWTCPGSRR